MAHFRLEYIVVWPETGTTSVCVMPLVSYFPVHYNSTNLDQPVWAPATSRRISSAPTTICTHFKHVMSAPLCIPLSLRSRAESGILDQARNLRTRLLQEPTSLSVVNRSVHQTWCSRCDPAHRVAPSTDLCILAILNPDPRRFRLLPRKSLVGV
jgi:hypothetical protein